MGPVDALGPFRIPHVGERLCRLYVPRADRAFRPDPPLLVLFDGQNMFDDAPSFAGGWRVHEAVERRARSRRRAVAPVVLGVDHGGLLRMRELNPFAASPLTEPLLDWIERTLLPKVRRRTGFALDEIWIGGSSLGGLAALYAHLGRPGVYRGALVMSPAIPLAGAAFDAWLARVPTPDVSRIYMDSGGKGGDERIARSAGLLAARLRSRGWRRDELFWRLVRTGRHNESHWRRRVPRALNFLFG